MKHLTNHLASTFSQTDNVITYGQLYLSLLIVAALFTIASVWVKKVKPST